MKKIAHDIKFHLPVFSGNELSCIEDILTESTFLNKSVSRKCFDILTNIYNRNIFLTQSCTNALEIICLNEKWGSGDEIIMPSYTYVSTANAFTNFDATPVFVDINPTDLNIDIAKIENAITSKTKAIVVVHYAGVACNMDAVLTICERHNLILIEDAAHAFGAYYKDKLLGTIGDYGAISFDHTKNIHCGQGGMLLVNGQLLGFSKKEIQSKFDEIVDFSGIEKFIDEPVKNYSNGMYLRLAFSIMAHLDFDVYLFDEVFSVGDAEFSMKTKIIIQKLCANNKTILLVSHNIEELYGQNNYILFEKGRLKEASNESILLSNYLESIFKLNSYDIYVKSCRIEDFSKYKRSKDIAVNYIELYQEGNNDYFTTDRPFILVVEYEKMVGKNTIDIMINISDLKDRTLITSSPIFYGNISKDESEGIYKYKSIIPAPLLNSHAYQISIFFLKNLSKIPSKANQIIDMNLMSNNTIQDSLIMNNVIAFKPILKTLHFQFDSNILISQQAGLLPAIKWSLEVQH